MKLRPYQDEAVAACYEYLRTNPGNPCIVLPTGGGKTPVMAQLVKDAVTRWRGRVVVLAHRKELLEQTHEKLGLVCPEVRAGIYSAGLGRRDTEQACIVAGIQSVYQRAAELGPVNFVIIDEAHLIPPEGMGRYRTFLQEAKVVNPGVRVIGLTATPYRLGAGNLCTPKGILTKICYEVSVKALIPEYLCPLVSKKGDDAAIADTSGVRVERGDFVQKDLAAAMGDEAIVRNAVLDIFNRIQGRRKVLIFACGVEHGAAVAREVGYNTSERVGFLTGETPAAERAELIEAFRDGLLRFLVNVNVLTEGFDAPNVDCVVLLRATKSPGLYYQMVGRGLRQHAAKEDCLILDYGENILRHGPIDDIRIQPKRKAASSDSEPPVKFCPVCGLAVAPAVLKCPGRGCGHEWPEPEIKHERKAEERFGVLSGAVKHKSAEVRRVRYYDHAKRDAPPGHPHTLWVEYELVTGLRVSEWVCLEHERDSWPQRKASKWWRDRCKTGAPPPRSCAFAAANAPGMLLCPTHIEFEVKSGGYPEVKGYTLPELTREPGIDAPEPDGTFNPYELDESEIPF